MAILRLLHRLTYRANLLRDRLKGSCLVRECLRMYIYICVHGIESQRTLAVWSSWLSPSLLLFTIEEQRVKGKRKERRRMTKKRHVGAQQERNEDGDARGSAHR